MSLPRRTSVTGFTLLELLVVMAIIAIALGLIAPATTGLLRSYNLKLATQNVIGQLNFARQCALANNQSVEVRFYNITDSLYPGTQTYRAIQCFLVDTDTGLASTTSNALTKPFFFPAGIIMAPDSGTAATPSSLFNTSATGGWGIVSAASPDTTHPLPPPYASASAYGTPAYLSFRFRPTGQTTLGAGPAVATNPPYLTIYPENAKIIANGLPADYATVQIDVTNGTVRVYQP